MKASEETIVKALTGNYRAEHLFTLKQALAAYDFAHQQMRECDQQIQQALAKFEDDENNTSSTPPDSSNSSDLPVEASVTYRRKNEPHFDMRPELKRIFGVDLLKLEGISTLTAMTLLAECGPDLSCFPTEAHFVSWLAVCPNNQITGGKIRKRRTRPVKNRLATALCLAAQSLHHSQSAMGAYFRRMRARLGAPKAITATAHRIARMIYMMLTRGEEYVAQGQAAYETKCKEQQIASLKRQAQRLGLTFLNPATGEVVS